MIKHSANWPGKVYRSLATRRRTSMRWSPSMTGRARSQPIWKPRPRRQVMGSTMVLLRLIYPSELKYLLRTGYSTLFCNRIPEQRCDTCCTSPRYYPAFPWKEVKLTLCCLRLEHLLLFIVGLYFCANRSFRCCKSVAIRKKRSGNIGHNGHLAR